MKSAAAGSVALLAFLSLASGACELHIDSASDKLKQCVATALPGEKNKDVPSVDGLLEACQPEFTALLSHFPKEARFKAELFLHDELKNQLFENLTAVR